MTDYKPLNPRVTRSLILNQVANDKYEGNFQDGLAHGHGRTFFADGGWHKGRYAKGKMNGYGVMQTSEGFEYTGTWKDDELHGEVLVQYL